MPAKKKEKKEKMLAMNFWFIKINVSKKNIGWQFSKFSILNIGQPIKKRIWAPVNSQDSQFMVVTGGGDDDFYPDACTRLVDRCCQAFEVGGLLEGDPLDASLATCV